MITDVETCGKVVDRTIAYANSSKNRKVTFIFSGKIPDPQKSNILVDSQRLAYQHDLVSNVPVAYLVGVDSIAKLELTLDEFEVVSSKVEQF